MTKQSILENLRIAIEALEAAPEEAIDLARFKSPCGTLFCFAGLLTTVPHFQALGMRLEEKYGWENYYSLKVKDTNYRNIWTELDEIFGKDSFSNLFENNQFISIISDKSIALARARKQIELVEASE